MTGPTGDVESPLPSPITRDERVRETSRYGIYYKRDVMVNMAGCKVVVFLLIPFLYLIRKA
jgi:hypothetical protein